MFKPLHVLAFTLALSSCTTLKEAATPTAPDFELSTFGGDSIHSSNLVGKIVVIDFWASWCSPCLKTFPDLQKVYNDYKDRDDIAFLVVNTSWNESRAEAVSFLVQNGFVLPVYWDEDGKMTAQFGIKSIPTTLVVGRDGRIRHHSRGFTGHNAHERFLRRAIEQELVASIVPSQ